MAIKNCYECGGKISTKAVSCPHCGAPQQQVLVPYHQGEGDPEVSHEAARKSRGSGLLRGCLLFLVGISALIVVFLFLYSITGLHRLEEPVAIEAAPIISPDAASPREPDETERTKQRKRLEFIQKLIAQQLFIKVEKPALYPRVFVGQGFYVLTFDEKAQFINVVWAFYKTEDPKADIVLIKDGYSGKEIGKYAEVYGGLKMY